MHTLVGGGGQRGGLMLLIIGRLNRVTQGKLGNYPILAYLPDKFARFLYEFHSYRFESLDLPPLPADRSDFDVHGALEDDQVHAANYPITSSPFLGVPPLKVHSSDVV